MQIEGGNSFLVFKVASRTICMIHLNSKPKHKYDRDRANNDGGKQQEVM